MFHQIVVICEAQWSYTQHKQNNVFNCCNSVFLSW